MNLIITCPRNLEDQTIDEIDTLLDQFGDTSAKISKTEFSGIIEITTSLEISQVVDNIREKINKYYIDNNHQTGVDDLNIIRGYNYVEKGNLNSYSSLVSFVKNNSFESDSVFNELSSIINIDQFINYWIYHIYFANIDSRGNARFWNSDSLGIKYRPILYDVDLGWFMCDSNLLKDFTSSVKTKWYNPPWRTLLLRKSLENKKFRNRFINQISYLINTHLNSENIVQ